MSRIIDADVLKEWIENWFAMNRHYHPYSRSNSIPTTELIDLIDRMPSVDAVEVIRCEKRKWWNIDGMPIADKHFCYELRDYVKPNFYCGLAERRQDES